MHANPCAKFSEIALEKFLLELWGGGGEERGGGVEILRDSRPADL